MKTTALTLALTVVATVVSAGGIVVDSDWDVGRYSSIAVIDGKPAISYADRTNGYLKFVRSTNENGTEWADPVIVGGASASGRNILGTALLEVEGFPAIAFSDGGVLWFVRATNSDGTSWGTEVEIGGGSPSNLAVVDGRPAVAFTEASFRKVQFVRALDSTGSVWATPVDVSQPYSNRGILPSLAIVNDRPSITYENSALRFRRADDAQGSSWGAYEQLGAVTDSVSLNVVNGNPAIAAITAGRVEFHRASNIDGTNWVAPVVIAQNNASGQVELVSQQNGRAFLVYVEDFNGWRLKYSQADSVAGDSWEEAETLTADDPVGSDISMTTVNGVPIVSYYDALNDDLKVVRPPRIFADGFESGNTDAWSTAR